MNETDRKIQNEMIESLNSNKKMKLTYLTSDECLKWTANCWSLTERNAKWMIESIIRKLKSYYLNDNVLSVKPFHGHTHKFNEFRLEDNVF